MAPVSSFLALTEASEMLAPVGSVTMPLTRAVVSTCAVDATGQRKATASTAKNKTSQGRTEDAPSSRFDTNGVSSFCTQNTLLTTYRLVHGKLLLLLGGHSVGLLSVAEWGLSNRAFYEI